MIKRIINRIRRDRNRLKAFPLKRLLASCWYNSKFPHLKTYQNLKQGLDIIAIGSSPAKFAINFTSQNTIKCANLAIMPETIFYDFQVVKNYHSYLKEGGIVLFVLCPFTFCKDKYRKEDGNILYKNIRYYPILHRAMVDNFDINLYNMWVKNPFSVGFEAKKAFFKELIRPYHAGGFYKAKGLSGAEMELSAQKRIASWMREFKMNKLSVDEIPQLVKDSIAYNIDIYKNMLVFLKERGYKYKVIIPPFSKELTAKIPEEFRNYTLFAPLKEIGADYISYIGDETWMKSEYFRDAFCMNEIGSKALTIDIVNRLTKENYFA